MLNMSIGGFRNSTFSEIDESMVNKQKQLVVKANSVCSVCHKQCESCIMMSPVCEHQACLECIEYKITMPVQNELDNRNKIQIDHVQCKAEDWCQNIIPVDILLPLLNLSHKDHVAEIEQIKDIYEDSICCPGEGNMQFIDQ